MLVGLVKRFLSFTPLELMGGQIDRIEKPTKSEKKVKKEKKFAPAPAIYILLLLPPAPAPAPRYTPAPRSCSSTTTYDSVMGWTSRWFL